MLLCVIPFKNTVYDIRYVILCGLFLKELSAQEMSFTGLGARTYRQESSRNITPFLEGISGVGLTPGLGITPGLGLGLTTGFGLLGRGLGAPGLDRGYYGGGDGGYRGGYCGGYGDGGLLALALVAGNDCCGPFGGNGTNLLLTGLAYGYGRGRF